MLRSPLRWVGGKSRLRDKILPLFPEHKCYCEVFGGAGWVLFGKDPETSKVEVINDIDGELINFYRVLKHRPAEFAESLYGELISRELFNEYREFEKATDEVERAKRFYYVMRLCFGGKREQRTFGTGTTGNPGDLKLSRILYLTHQWSTRLERVIIENVTWEKCLAIYDRPHTFFYLDPPYTQTKKDMYRDLTVKQHEELAAALFKLKGKWMLSYDDSPLVRKLYRRRGLKIDRLKITYTLGGKAGKGARRQELLIRNF